MESLVRVASSQLCQWSMDFDGNLQRVEESIRQAKAAGCRLRTGPELELCGYSCQDHFLESDTVLHCWESVARLLGGDLTDGILVDVGMPVLHNDVRYNCRVFLCNRRVVALRPKMALASDGNYFEYRFFAAWPAGSARVDSFQLPPAVTAVTGQREVPLGVFVLQLNDTTVAVESCEELFVPDNPHIRWGLAGAEIVMNGSGSHHRLRKLDARLRLVVGATARCGGAYMYSNQVGCDGERLYFDGCSMVSVNGELVAQANQFSVQEVEVAVATIDLEEIRSFRAASPSRNVQAVALPPPPTVRLDFSLAIPAGTRPRPSPSRPVAARLYPVEEEIALGPACWLWDYLRRSGASGYFLPLSGGADSAATAALVGVMCRLVVDTIARGAGGQSLVADARRVAGERADSSYVPTDAREFCDRVMHTSYMGSANSSSETRDRARRLASDLGAYHVDVNIDGMVSAVVACFSMATGRTPRFRAHGGVTAENLALQNIQARIRMVFGYMMAQLLPWVRGRSGFLLVLGSANVDEALRGYLTKYDCSSADINPIGGISKADLKRFLLWAGRNQKLGIPTLLDVVAAPPTAELEPITADYRQADEEDMGMTYDELSTYGRLRKLLRCGPVAMYQKLRHVWADKPPRVVADKVRRFFYYYSVNRHKQPTLTCSLHCEDYSPSDHRFDQRQILYNTAWSRQFAAIEALVDDEPASEPVAVGSSSKL